MTVYIKPSVAHGKVSAPPSKSLSHRALICAALSGGSRIANIEKNDDIKATLEGLKSLGASVKESDGFITVGGINKTDTCDVQIYANESGSTLRFLIPLALALGKKTVFFGKERLFFRDLSVYEDIAKKDGIEFVKNSNSLTVCGKLQSGEYNVAGDISSQFISGLMFALPLLSGDSVIKFKTQVKSKPYIDMTVKVLSDFGVTVTPIEGGYCIPGSQSYLPRQFTAEGDYSNAAFLDAFNLLGGNVKVEGLNPDTVQGDRIYKDFYKVIKSGGSFDLGDCPDLAPVMFALASEFAGGHFIGTNRLKIKESDRAAAMKEELKKFGGDLIIGEDEVTVNNTNLHAPKEPLCSHNDHRIVMALSVIASVHGGIIEGAEAVNKSYPAFFDDIKKLGIEVDMK